jgi:hypothetical protein
MTASSLPQRLTAVPTIPSALRCFEVVCRASDGPLASHPALCHGRGDGRTHGVGVARGPLKFWTVTLREEA